MNRNNIIKIQRYYRVYLLKKNLLKIKEFKLSETKNFGELTVLLRNKKIINQMITVLKLFDNFSCIPLNIKPQIILTAYLIKNYPNDIIGSQKDRHPIDKELLINSLKLVSLFEHFNNLNYHLCVSINKFIKQYYELFNFWKDIDKTRTIQNIIVSYYNRKKHLKYLDTEKMNEEQKSKMINSLNNECKVLISQIKTIDPDFDIEYLKNNYEELYLNIEKMMNEIYNKISINFKKVFIETYKNDLNKNEYNNIIKFINETNERILLITPNKFANSIIKKLKSFDFFTIIQTNSWNKDIKDYLNFLIDTIIIYSCKENDENNKIWKNDMNILMSSNYNNNLPLILLEINNKIDVIIEQIKKLI
jgi:hypothetical protein